ncbi:hypothetical protein Skr01_53710 [Sphaerisporangium krabiense]|uniref:CATRA-Associated Small Protein domain-containing protein n=1 Tax=Sphaerisporangium krabiense TaxID=763782 RepID=A0A7W9DQ79_9ACTN|nr:CATRA system-associated protein [Sphaerisporangium krabiense]MBB5627128.1 hypothetical protein [Sphaerisporangium krabiense]GII65286.1 hypothetical protein Skr01_53710 [Sphaerisporangium krabiense]
MPDPSAHLLDDARDLLEDVLQWQMSPARWDHLTGILDAAIAAAESGDLDALDAAVVRMEVAGPVRIQRIGEESADPPPAPVRDRVNHLVHLLATPPDAPAGQAGE